MVSSALAMCVCVCVCTCVCVCVWLATALLLRMQFLEGPRTHTLHMHLSGVHGQCVLKTLEE